MLCFCRRGRQNLRQLKKSHFAVLVDASGKKFVTKVVDELTKNHRENDEAKQGGMMYATEGLFCPVASFEKYLKHLTHRMNSCFNVQRRIQRQIVMFGMTTWLSAKDTSAT